MAALEDKVTTLGQEADRLCGIHADHADQIQAKRAEIVEYWESLTTKAKVCFLAFIYFAFVGICSALHYFVNPVANICSLRFYDMSQVMEN